MYDSVHHHKFISIIENKIHDPRTIRLIWKFLRAGYMNREKKVEKETTVITKQPLCVFCGTNPGGKPPAPSGLRFVRRRKPKPILRNVSKISTIFTSIYLHCFDGFMKNITQYVVPPNGLCPTPDVMRKLQKAITRESNREQKKLLIEQ